MLHLGKLAVTPVLAHACKKDRQKNSHGIAKQINIRSQTLLLCFVVIQSRERLIRRAAELIDYQINCIPGGGLDNLIKSYRV